MRRPKLLLQLSFGPSSTLAQSVGKVAGLSPNLWAQLAKALAES